MASSILNPDVLRELLKLSEEKASLEKKAAAIDARLEALLGGASAAKAPKAPAATGKRRGRPAKAAKAPKAPKAPKAAKTPKAPKAAGKRGALKGNILNLLANAGPEGATVKDIAANLGVKTQNVHVWFSTTGKKLAEILKVGEARYAFKLPTGSSLQPEA